MMWPTLKENMLQNIFWKLMRENVIAVCGFACKPFTHIKEQKSPLSDQLEKGSQIRGQQG